MTPAETRPRGCLREGRRRKRAGGGGWLAGESEGRELERGQARASGATRQGPAGRGAGKWARGWRAAGPTSVGALAGEVNRGVVARVACLVGHSPPRSPCAVAAHAGGWRLRRGPAGRARTAQAGARPGVHAPCTRTCWIIGKCVDPPLVESAACVAACQQACGQGRQGRLGGPGRAVCHQQVADKVVAGPGRLAP
jgi:hypothetical protein